MQESPPSPEPTAPAALPQATGHAPPKKQGCAKWVLIGCGGTLFAGVAALVVVLVLLGSGWNKLMHWLEGGDQPEPRAGWCSAAADCCLLAAGGRFGSRLTQDRQAGCEGIRQEEDRKCQLTYAQYMRTARRWGRLCSYTTKEGGRYHPE